VTTIDDLASGFDHNDQAMRVHCGEVYGRLRESCPVFHSDRWGGFWVASRYEDVYAAGRDPDRFASGPGTLLPPIGHGRPLRPMDSDAPEHAAYRDLLLPSFAPNAVVGMEDDVRALAADLLDAVYDDHHADLYEVLAKPLPMLVITRLLGIERDERFWEWTDILMYGRVGGAGQEQIVEAAHGLYAYLALQLENRRTDPRRDLLTLLLDGHVGDRPFTADEILDLAFFLVIAGLENTAFGIRATLRHLAVHTDHRDAVLADPSLIPNVVEQSLRLYTPVTALARWTTRETELGGCPIGAGERVLLLFGSANRDAAVFADADEFHLDRRDGRHIAFGIGPHRCIGSNLARLELRVALEETLRRIPDYRLAGEDPGWGVAGPLEVVW
jgi:cytochrome P450